ncbi:unnamed protein product [Clonostachys rhizophaga]|uniref:Uncharacterized protein n=1 Tax=Clonostachys rhizophaga TaxID=160324 RepID=A0A9N9YL40_9HYPO|nr:unnamed protein product [Clonostachys rhizophaga]
MVREDRQVKLKSTQGVKQILSNPIKAEDSRKRLGWIIGFEDIMAQLYLLLSILGAGSSIFFCIR